MKSGLIKIDVSGMSRTEWLAQRRKGLGGSDAASVLGLNEYNSPYALWCEKTGKIVPNESEDSEAIRLGNDLEQYVAERFMEATGEKVRRSNFMFKNDEFPFAHANPDRLVIGEDAGLECKTTSSWETAKMLRNGEIPKRWYCQCCHYMMVTGCRKWYLAALAFGAGFFYFALEREEAEIQALAEAEREFWARVCNGTPPSIDGSDATTEAIQSLYYESDSLNQLDLSAVGSHIEAYNAIEKKIKELEEMQTEHENAIKVYMGDCEKGEYGDNSVTWKSIKRRTFDRESFERENGKIPEKFFKDKQSRSFRVVTKRRGDSSATFD